MGDFSAGQREEQLIPRRFRRCSNERTGDDDSGSERALRFRSRAERSSRRDSRPTSNRFNPAHERRVEPCRSEPELDSSPFHFRAATMEMNVLGLFAMAIGRDLQGHAALFTDVLFALLRRSQPLVVFDGRGHGKPPSKEDADRSSLFVNERRRGPRGQPGETRASSERARNAVLRSCASSVRIFSRAVASGARRTADGCQVITV